MLQQNPLHIPYVPYLFKQFDDFFNLVLVSLSIWVIIKDGELFSDTWQ